MSGSGRPEEPAGPGRPDRGGAAVRLADATLRVAGAVVAVVLAVITALYEAFESALFLGTVRLPLSPVLAVIANLALVWFTYVVTGARWPIALPALAWFVVMLAAAKITTERDVVLAGNNWVGILTIFAGSLAFAIGVYRLMVPGPPAGRPR